MAGDRKTAGAYFDATANVRLILATCEQSGVPAERVLREAGVSPARVAPPALHISWGELERVWDAAERLTGDPCIGLHAGLSVTAAHFGPPVHYTLNQPLIRTMALIGWGMMMPRWCNAVSWELVEGSPCSRFRYRAKAPETAAANHLVDFYVGVIVNSCRVVISPQWNPLEVRLRRSDPAEPQEYERLLGCRVTFGESDNDVFIDNETLDLPNLLYDPALNGWLKPIFEAHLEAMEQDLGATLWVRDQLATALHDGRLTTLEQIARTLHRSARTLQEQLRHEGTTYREILDTVRRELAMVWLRNSTVSVGSISQRLGFGDDAALVRAFRRWTGQTPAQWRRELAAD